MYIFIVLGLSLSATTLETSKQGHLEIVGKHLCWVETSMQCMLGGLGKMRTMALHVVT